MCKDLIARCDMNGYLSIIDEVQMFATQWMYKYNYQRPNKALGGITPKQRLVMTA